MAVFLLIFISCLVLGGGARQILLLHCHLAPFNQKANLFVVENNLPDRQTSLLPFLNPICKASLMKIFKISRRNSGEIQSIGGNLIPTSGNPEISVFSFQKFSIPKSRMVTCNYWSPRGQHGAWKKYESENQVTWDLLFSPSRTRL